MFDKIKSWFVWADKDSQLRKRLDQLRQRTPVPVFWLFGKTQSGKTSIIKYLTGADDAEIGQGFQPCTRFSRRYQFPVPEAPLVTFLDTRGIDEPNYDPHVDLAQFDREAHVVVVTVKAMDHAQESIVEHVRTIRAARPERPVVLALTCLHEAYPQQQHPQPYPFTAEDGGASLNGQQEHLGPLFRSLEEQRRRFTGLVDVAVPIDLTPSEEGFNQPDYGGDRLKQTLLDVLPAAYRQTLLTLEEATRDLQDLYAEHALPHIVGYSSLAASAGAIPIPWVDLLIIPAIQARMIYHLARFYGQPLSARRFLELASTLGLGMVMRQASRELMKLIPYVGSVAGGVLAGTSTFALGKAFCYYFRVVHQGHIPRPEELKRYYHEELARAEQSWKSLKDRAARPAPLAEPRQENATRD